MVKPYGDYCLWWSDPQVVLLPPSGHSAPIPDKLDATVFSNIIAIRTANELTAFYLRSGRLQGSA